MACEDTRVTAQLLRHLGLHKPLLALHGHNEHAAAAAVLARLARRRVGGLCQRRRHAGVSATPAPCWWPQAAAAGHRWCRCPGPAARWRRSAWPATRWAQGFRFVGFLPAKGGERRAALAARAGRRGARRCCSRRRTASTRWSPNWPRRRRSAALTLARELTKQFETIVTVPAAELPAWLAADANRQRGEFVLVLHALPAAPAAADALRPATLHTLRVLLRELPLKQAVALAAEITGAPRNALYQRALAERDGAGARGATDAGEAGDTDPTRA